MAPRQRTRGAAVISGQRARRLQAHAALLAMCIMSVALTYHDPAPPSVATIRTRAPHDYHGRGCAHWHAIERATVNVASQASALLRPWLQ